MIFVPGTGLGRIRFGSRADSKQILMNLAANSRDGPCFKGGRLRIETSDVRLDEEYVDRKKSHHSPSVRYAVLTVTRQPAPGIPADHLSHVFRTLLPTTQNPPVKVPGLGLATVYGIVKQKSWIRLGLQRTGNGHHLQNLPCLACWISQSLCGNSRHTRLRPCSGGTETVLLVEDEEALRRARRRVPRPSRIQRSGSARRTGRPVRSTRNHASTIHLAHHRCRNAPHERRRSWRRNWIRACGPRETRVLIRLRIRLVKTVLDHRVIDVDYNSYRSLSR